MILWFSGRGDKDMPILSRFWTRGAAMSERLRALAGRGRAPPGDPVPHRGLARAAETVDLLSGPGARGRRRHRDRPPLQRSPGRRSGDPGHQPPRCPPGSPRRGSWSWPRLSGRSEVPLVAMGYLNPILAYGARASSPTRRRPGWTASSCPTCLRRRRGPHGAAARRGLSWIFLAAPNSTDDAPPADGRAVQGPELLRLGGRGHRGPRRPARGARRLSGPRRPGG